MKSTCDCCGGQISAPHRVQEDNGREGWVCAKCWKRVCDAADWGHQGRGKLFFTPSGPPEGERVEKNVGLSLQAHKPRDPNDDIPGWLKKILKERGGRIEDAARRALGSPYAQVDWPAKLGCGHYGCAWGILEPGGDKPRYVVKITRDPTEGPMQATIAKRQQAGDYGFEDGFAIVRGVYRLEPDVSWKGKMWPVYAIVREEVAPILILSGKGVMFYGHMGAESRDEVPGIYPKVTRAQLGRAIDALHAYKDVAAKWYAQKALKRPKQYKIDDLESKMQEHLNRISDWLPTIGTVMGILQEEGTPLRDVHANNVGVRRHEGVVSPDDPKNGIGYPVVFDPGHLPNSDEEVEREIARLNPDIFDSLEGRDAQNPRKKSWELTQQEFTARRYPIRPALRVDDKDVYIGKAGQIHGEVLDLLPQEAFDSQKHWIDSGWADKHGNWLTRDQAEEIVASIDADYKMGGFGGHSGHVRGQGQRRHEKVVRAAVAKGLPVPERVRLQYKINPTCDNDCLCAWIIRSGL